MKTYLPPAFVEKYSRIMSEESEEFFEACKIKIPKSIWANSLKIKPEILLKDLEKKEWKLNPLFHENAFSLDGIERPGQSEEFKQGLFNLQEKSAMLPALILCPEERDLVLDATSAPGNKTLQLACLMNGKGKIVCVEKSVQRYKSLFFNAKKFGMKNAVLKRMDLLDAKKKNLFDKVLLDAPCSSEGLVRKDFDALRNWSQELVERKAELQKKMIAKSYELLKENGVMVYCTCTLSPEENEEVVQHLIESTNCGIEKIPFKEFKFREGMQEYNGAQYDDALKKTVRVYPQDNDSQAFFIAKIRKTST